MAKPSTRYPHFYSSKRKKKKRTHSSPKTSPESLRPKGKKSKILDADSSISNDDETEDNEEEGWITPRIERQIKKLQKAANCRVTMTSKDFVKTKTSKN